MVAIEYVLTIELWTKYPGPTYGPYPGLKISLLNLEKQIILQLLGLRSGYHHIALDLDAIKKTALFHFLFKIWIS